MQPNKPSIAIIGSGITGIGASWLLHDKYEITLFERNDYLGGHTHTHDIKHGNDHLAIDSGFIVYNEKNYPNLVGLFKQLEVETQETDMSFAFSLNQGEIEYSGSGLNGMFAQRRNIFKPKHYRLISEILRFNKLAHETLGKNTQKTLAETQLSLGEFLTKHQLSTDFKLHYLLPMGAAIWSCPVDTMLKFPAHSFLRFFANHGLIDLKNRPQWQTVVGGSNQYIKKIKSQIETLITIKTAAIFVTRDEHKVKVQTNSEILEFDQIIFACHADEALSLLTDSSENEKNVLKHFTYQKNIAYLHTDKSLMPQRKKAWSAWNYLASNDESSHQIMTASYWMNCLQRFQAEHDYFVTLNPFKKPDKEKTLQRMEYQHPVFDKAAVDAQKELHTIQGKNKAWFCGAYAGYGFHEDGLASAVSACKHLGIKIPWEMQS